MVDDVLVRTLTADDLNRLVAIDARLTGRSRRAFFEGALTRAMRDTDVRVSLGAEIDGHLVGAVLGSVRYGEFGQAEPSAVIETLVVDPDSSRRGVGTALMDQLAKNLGALRVESLRTEVSWDDGELLFFLRKYGFRPTPRMVLEYRLD